MIAHGAFAGIPNGTIVRDAVYVPIGKTGEVEEKSALKKEESLTGVAREHLKGLIKYASQFRDPQTPYLSRPIPQFAGRFNDYDHLARTAEWSSLDGEGGD